MILRRLVEYADRLENAGELTPPMYGKAEIRWLISLTKDGELEGFVRQTAGNKNQDGQMMTVPTLRRTSVIRPRLLADNGEYVLADPRRDSSLEKTQDVAERHRQFLNLARLCADETEEPSVMALVKWLEPIS